MHTGLETVDGMQFDVLSESLLRHRRRAAGSDSGRAYILIYEKKISAMKDLLPLLEQVARAASRC